MTNVVFVYPKGALLEVSPDLPDGIDGFKDNCLWGGKVICDWTLLESYLVSGDVERYWWYLTTPERFSITENAVKNTLFYYIRYYGRGNANCTGGVTYWDTATCGHNAAIRALKFSPPMPTPDPYDPVDYCYYKDPLIEHCYIPDENHNLPCHWASWNTTEISHSMCAIQIDKDTTILTSWYIFQYASANIKHGHQQMDGPGTLEIGKINSIGCNGCGYTTAARFEL